MKKAVLEQAACVACGCCVKVCPRNAIGLLGGVRAQIDEGRCVGCGLCAKACPASIITLEVRG